MSAYCINAVAPTRICDVGGWTDTHFACYGAVMNIAIYPYVEVQVYPQRVTGTSAAEIRIHAENYGESFSFRPDTRCNDMHPLLVAAVRVMGVPEDISVRINIFSYAPPGASMGTSASVSVALLGALAALTERKYTPHDIAALAHRVETEELGLEAGVQDQIASAYGGINYVEIDAYPHAAVESITLSDDIWWELENRLVVAYIGQPHSSSAIHKKVIAGLAGDPSQDPRLARLRALAREAQSALCCGDFDTLGDIFNENTAVQRALHPALICEAFERIVEEATAFNVRGCKVNGAGGDGGSIALLTDGDMAKKRALQQRLQTCGYQVLPVYLSRRGLRVWHSGRG